MVKIYSECMPSLVVTQYLTPSGAGNVFVKKIHDLGLHLLGDQSVHMMDLTTECRFFFFALWGKFFLI